MANKIISKKKELELDKKLERKSKKNNSKRIVKK